MRNEDNRKEDCKSKTYMILVSVGLLNLQIRQIMSILNGFKISWSTLIVYTKLNLIVVNEFNSWIIYNTSSLLKCVSSTVLTKNILTLEIVTT